MAKISTNTEQVPIDNLVVTFDEGLYDHYLSYAGMPPRHYITYINEIKAGFSTKYQLHRLLKFLKEIFPTGIIPAKALQYQPIPTVSEPIIRRLGKIQVVEKKFDKVQRNSLREIDWEYMTGGIDTNAVINGRNVEGPRV